MKAREGIYSASPLATAADGSQIALRSLTWWIAEHRSGLTPLHFA